ncbi:MAG: cobalt-precorrin-6A reductase [Pleurocapsa sp.]
MFDEINTIWLIGGTSESVAIAKEIATAELSLIITVTSESARSLYPSGLEIHVGSLNRQQMEYFCREKRISKIVDASHPFAAEVSQNAIAIATTFNLPYLRYQRPSLQLAENANSSSLVTVLDSFQTLLKGSYLQNQRVLLTIGCKALPLFESWQKHAVLFARVLPNTESLQIALNSGFTSDRLIALRPPLTAELEMALWQQWDISTVVTKASGKAGGEDIKQQVAARLKIPLIIIARPQVFYPQQTDSINKVMAFCRSK